MAEETYTVTTDEWIVARLVASVAPGTDPVETIETLRTIREHVWDTAHALGFDLDDPVGVDRAELAFREAVPALARTQIRVVAS